MRREVHRSTIPAEPKKTPQTAWADQKEAGCLGDRTGRYCREDGLWFSSTGASVAGEILVHERHGYGALTDAGGHPLHRAMPYVARREDTGHAGLDHIPPILPCPARPPHPTRHPQPSPLPPPPP